MSPSSSEFLPVPSRLSTTSLWSLWENICKAQNIKTCLPLETISMFLHLTHSCLHHLLLSVYSAYGGSENVSYKIYLSLISATVLQWSNTNTNFKNTNLTISIPWLKLFNDTLQVKFKCSPRFNVLSCLIKT